MTMPHSHPARQLCHPAIARIVKPAFAALAACLLLTAAAPAFAYSSSSTAPNEFDLDNHNTYQNSSGETVHSPAHSKSGRVPEGATARCRDGTYSFSRHRRGTCSGHGGVAAWL
ncbi:DUF3761 domain-containing protein [Trinickia sp. YCB016]